MGIREFALQAATERNPRAMTTEIPRSPQDARKSAASLLHATSLASTASSPSFQVRTRALRPVAAAITSYGRSSKIQDRRINKTTTLYVIRVARSGKHWYVARRYSEFRALHGALQAQFAHEERIACAACHELATFYNGFRFPQRFRVRSVLFMKRELESTRMDELNQYLSFLMETTQGLLDDDDDYDQDEEGAKECKAMALIRDFLMVDENEHLTKQATKQNTQSDDAARSGRRPRLNSKSSSVSSFRVHELDVLYREKDPGCVSCADPLAPANSVDYCDLIYADVFNDFASPPEDAIIQHQASDDEPLRPTLSRALRRSESLCRSLH
uniref:PX domain-containing protein n=1 Tax=Globisporangium ultimum (strain ATCC 200006 / CBS 805.95 / DAOM BR144) TaxID=431595 RepID=K3W5V4_GLOUD